MSLADPSPDYDTVLRSLTTLFSDERARLARDRETVVEATIGLLDEIGKVHVRVAMVTFNLVVRPDLQRMQNDPDFWLENIRGWEMLAIDYKPLAYSPAVSRELATHLHVRQSLLPIYLAEWTKALYADTGRTL